MKHIKSWLFRGVIDAPLLEACFIIQIKDNFPLIDLETDFLNRMAMIKPRSTVLNLAVAVIKGNAVLENFDINLMHKVINDLAAIKNQISKDFGNHISIFVSALRFRTSVETSTCTKDSKRLFITDLTSYSIKTLFNSRKYFAGYGLFCRFLDALVKHTLRNICNLNDALTCLQNKLPPEYRILSKIDPKKNYDSYATSLQSALQEAEKEFRETNMLKQIKNI